MPSRHDPAASLADILENLERIEDYVAGLDREAFGGDTLRRDAVERCLERICEAAFRLGEMEFSVIRLGSCTGEVEYLAVSVAIARFQNRLKTDRSLQRRAKQIEKLLKVDSGEKPRSH